MYIYLYFFSQGVDIETVVQGCQPEPLVVVVGDHHDAQQAFLVSENKTVCEITVSDILIYLLAMYYVFNMCYPKGCDDFYSFMEIALFKLPVNVPGSVVNFLTRLDSVMHC